MCDYSLENVASRPARVADRLVSTTFTNTFTRGFTAEECVGQAEVAVCLTPGTEVAFDEPPRYEAPVTYQITQASGKVARFVEVDKKNQRVHHDALEFPNGEVVLVSRLLPDQRAVVLQLPASKPVKGEAERPTNEVLVATGY